MEYKRILLKLSGEALALNTDGTYNIDILGNLKDQILKLKENGIEVAIVVGGGNIWRGVEAPKEIEESRAHYMGMMATTMNTIALESFFNSNGLETYVQNSMEIVGLYPEIDGEKAIDALTSGKVVIFGGGTGRPFVSTDTAAAERAIEIKADAILIAKNGTDGVYDSDPKQNPDAKFFNEITYDEILDKDLKIIDKEAIELLKTSDLDVIVFNMNKPDNITSLFNDKEMLKTIIRK